MNPDDERVAEALMLVGLHGAAGAQVHVAERVGAMVLAGDVRGLERWRQIAAAMDVLLRGARH